MAPKLLFCLLLTVAFTLGHAQVVDDFSDGDITANPAWEGEPAFWQVSTAQELQSNGPSASEELYLVTASTTALNAEWQGTVRYTSGGPSTSNQVRIYLISDEDSLEGDVNGYYLQMGESGSNDAVELYRQDGGSDSLLIRGTDGTIGGGIDLRYRVQRDAAGAWTLELDTDGDDAWELQGTSLEATYTTSTWFGIWLKHSSTRNEDFFFDDIYVGPPIVDMEAPRALNLSVDGPDSLTVLFSERLAPGPAENLTNIVLQNGNLNPVASRLLAPDSTRLSLKFGSTFSQQTNYQLIISNQEDTLGNVASTPDTLDFFYFVPDEPEAGDVVIHEIFADPTPVIAMPDGEFVELYNRSNKTFSTAGWTFTNGTVVSSLPTMVMEPGDYFILAPLADTALWSSFGRVLGLSPWTALVNSGDDLGLRDAGGELLDSVQYRLDWYQDDMKAMGGWSLEMIDADNTDCPDIANWRASEATFAGTPGTANSLAGFVDVTPPVLLDATIIAPDTVRLCFDEPLDSVRASDPVFYRVSSIFSIIRAIPIGPSFSCVDLFLAEPIPEGVITEVSVSNLADCKGNVMQTGGVAFVLRSATPLSGDVIINEIFPDFSPVVGLPEAEFVEVLNRSKKAFDLRQWTFSDGGSPAEFGSFILGPNEYLILCDEDDTAAFSVFGKVLGVDGFPGLNNDSDALFLAGPDGTLIDQVTYDNSWYREDEKRGGGWTLERIDTADVRCSGAPNWRDSHAAIGGTPGKQNIVFGIVFDEEAPQLLNFGVGPVATSYILEFSENMISESVVPAAFDLESVGAPDNVALSADGQTVTITFSGQLTGGRTYTLGYDGLEDCFGNVAVGSVLVGLPEEALPGDILLNEILFNPYTGGNDFVEIINVSDKIIDLQTLGIGEGEVGSDTLFNADQLAETSTLLLPGAILCLTTDTSLQRITYLPPDDAQFLEMDGFPTYSDNEGVVVLFSVKDSINTVLDRFEYLDDYHFVTLADENGVSLERISVEVPTQDPANWHSAASTVNYATPGYANSQQVDLPEPPSAVSLVNNLISPDGDSQDDVLTIQYDFDFIGGNARVIVYDMEGRVVKRVAENTLLSNQSGFFTWDGSDERMGKAPIGAYVVMVEIVAPDGKREVYKLACAVVGGF